MKKIYYLVTTLSLICSLLFLSCSRSGKRPVSNNPNSERLRNSEVTRNKTTPQTPESKQDKTVVKMKKAMGVYEIPTEINGVPMHFIFDTGASRISISEAEIKLLREQGKFSPEDVTGTGNFIDANGDISEGTIVVLKTVKIGDRILNNIEASVVHNLKAPLLMGQSALEKFGKISIDYKKEEITFE
jgi:aspartyl protease family protein